jgi:hypothetical protein
VDHIPQVVVKSTTESASYQPYPNELEEAEMPYLVEQAKDAWYQRQKRRKRPETDKEAFYAFLGRNYVALNDSAREELMEWWNDWKHRERFA